MTTKTKLTLDEIWILCLQMWKWISEVYDGTASVCTLKHCWLKANGFEGLTVYGNCFFCNYDPGLCKNCPGRLVDADFSCINPAYPYETNPVAFYKKLLRLNKIRTTKDAEK